MSDFAQDIKNFTVLTAHDAQAKIDSGEKFILFIGRSTCPFCRRFAPKLSQVAQDTGARVSFLNSEDATDLANIQILRDTYSIKTVPGLLVAENGKVKVVCDSSLSEKEIADFIA